MAGPRTPKGRARAVHARLAEAYPAAECELNHSNAFELLVATILSAQCTDERVNRVTPILFATYPSPMALAGASLPELESIVHPTGFYANKARSLVAMAQRLVEVYDGDVPSSMADLTSLAGVGRKTANLLRCVVMGLPGLPVDTHVARVSRRLGLTTQTDPVKIEAELDPLVPAAERGKLGLRLILHGRRVCAAKKPQCDDCVVSDICPVAGTG